MIPGCDESAPTKRRVFLTLRMPGRVGMCRRANVVRYASFLWTSEGSVLNSVRVLAREQGMPGCEVSASPVALGIEHSMLGGAKKAGSMRGL
jgi:hypothetical protein